MTKSSRLPPSSCLACGQPNDAATSFVDAVPKPDDFALCYYCGHVMAYANDLTLRALTGMEMIQVAGDKRILVAQAAIVAARLGGKLK